MKQLLLIDKLKAEHGGSLGQGKRKKWRPLSTKKVQHLVLKCEKNISLFNNIDFVQATIKRQAERAGVKIYGLSVQHDHIHMAIFFSDREQYNKFVRIVTSLLARKFGRGMWKFRPYTKIVEWGRQYKNLKTYLRQNDLEVRGVIAYQPRGK